jgi:ABC-type transport system substrate-binding protein
LQVLDRYTFRVRLERPNPRFVNTLALANPLGAVAREVVEMYGDQIMAHPVGTGPFRLAQWTRTSRIVLERNPTYREETYGFDAPTNSPRLADDVQRLRGRRVPLVDRVEVTIIQEAQPRLLSFEQGGLDHLLVPIEYGTLVAPNGKLAPNLAARCAARCHADGRSGDDSSTWRTAGRRLHAGEGRLRRAISLALTKRLLRQVFKGYGVAGQSPIVPALSAMTAVADWHVGVPGQSWALLDTYGYIDRNGDGWRERPDGSPLILEKAASPSEIDRRQSEQWRRYMTTIGLKIEFRIAPWPELVKQSLAGNLMIWNFAWQAGEPDGDLFFSLAYGPNKGSANDARFSLKAYDELYERQRTLPDGSERLSAMHDASRLLVAYMPYKFHLHRIQLDLAQPWLIGYRRHPFTTRAWAYLDIDSDARERPQA